tara:strand:- start:224 stop:865 length:642 start_codon:yes stop_codon:yes gene_type:complete
VKTTYKITRFLLMPIIILADFLQTNFTKHFTPMNMGPVTEPSYTNEIKKFFFNKDYVMDFGCGIGYFCNIFDKKKYIGLEINPKFIKRAKEINEQYIFKNFKDKKIKKLTKRVNAVLINNVLHHMSDEQVKNAVKFIKQNSKQGKVKLIAIEPVFPKKFFSLQFFLKALDIGNYIRTTSEYKKILKRNFKIKKSYTQKVGIANSVIFFCELKR